MKMFTKATRNGEPIDTINSSFTHYTELRDLLYRLHGGIFPIDQLYTLAKDCFESLMECESCEESYNDDSIYNNHLIYTDDTNHLYKTLNKVLESTYENWNEFVFIDTNISPYDYQNKCVSAYLTWALNECRNFLESIDYWNK